MNGHALRIASVMLPILVIFLLPALGVGAGPGFTLLVALLASIPLFVFELKNGDGNGPASPAGRNHEGDLS